MENFFEYTVNNYTLSAEAKRMLDSIVLWTGDHYEDHGTLTQEGIHFLKAIVADSIGMERAEIIENWR